MRAHHVSPQHDIGVCTLSFLYRNAEPLVMIIATLTALCAKFAVAQYPTNDVVGYIFQWMEEIEAVGFTNFYTIDADYSPMYLFFIGLLSFIPKGASLSISGYVFHCNWMLALKGCYFIVDIINALAVYLIIREVSHSKYKAVVGYLIMTALPVQFINSAVWGQSDCIYTCLLLFSLYSALRNHGKLSFLMFGFALANKLQAVFLAPFLLYMLLQRRLKPSAVIFTPAAILISFFPAYICGAGFVEPFVFFAEQLNGYSVLTLGCANFWDLFAFRDSVLDIMNRGAVIIGLLCIGVLFAIIWLRLIQNSAENLLSVAVFLTGAAAFFLPHMHERYFYPLDILVVVYALCKGKRYCLIPMMQASSGIAYYAYISGRCYFEQLGEDSLHIATLINIAVLCVLFSDLFHAEYRTLHETLAELQCSGNECL